MLAARLIVICIAFAQTLAMPTLAWSASIQKAMSQPGRLAADLARDQRSKPEQVIPLLQLQAGARVVDLFGSGGYYSELLAAVVGERGEVLLHNNRGFRAWGINILDDRFGEHRINGPALHNLVQHDREIENLDLGIGTLDGAILVMAFHDLYVVPSRYNGERYVPVGPPADVDHFMRQVHRALKPGARFVIVDHQAGSDMPLAEALELHRIHAAFTISELERFGFRYITSTDALANPADDHSHIVFDPDVEGRTDRFVLVFERI